MLENPREALRPLQAGAINVTTKKEGESEFLANRLFMLISGLLIAVSLAAFLWLAGVVEWRGSDGDSSIDVTPQCRNPAPKGIWAITFLDCEDSTIEVDLGSDTDIGDLKQYCPTTIIRSTRKPRTVISPERPMRPVTIRRSRPTSYRNRQAPDRPRNRRKFPPWSD
jgi:hypothetical protein